LELTSKFDRLTLPYVVSESIASERISKIARSMSARESSILLFYAL